MGRHAARLQLARRWRARKASGRFRGIKIGIRRFLRKMPRLNHRWPWSGRRGSVDLLSKGYLMASNPRRRHYRHRRGAYAFRINPSIAGVTGMVTKPVMAFPANVKRLFSGRGMIMNVAVATGGAAIALAGGTMLQRFTVPLLSKIPGVGTVMANPIGLRVVGSLHAFTAIAVVAKFVPLSSDKKQALMTGGMAAVLTELIFPGKASAMLAKIPVLGPMIAPASPVLGLLGYVTAPDYQAQGGLGTYLTAPANQSIGQYGDNAIAGYVVAPANQSMGNLPMGSFLSEDFLAKSFLDD